MQGHLAGLIRGCLDAGAARRGFFADECHDFPYLSPHRQDEH